MRGPRLTGALLALALAALRPVDAGEWRLSGSIAAEVRHFVESGAHPGQSEATVGGLTLAPELRWRSEDRRRRVTLIPFGRYDSVDEERSHLDLREGYWAFGDDGYEVLVGVNKVFWGVTESRHLVDVINQTDLVEDIDGEDKLGQPMLQLTASRDWGTLALFVMPTFRERTFPGREGRLRPPLTIDDRDPLYESAAGRDRVDVALRWSHFLGDWDLGLSHFHGTGREPRLLPDPQGPAEPPRLRPAYDVIHQSGVDVQYTRGAWLYKLEAALREGQGRTFGAAVAGFEYTLYQKLGAAGDIGLLLELLWDDRDTSAPTTPFDEDLFAGTRLALNDEQGSELLVGAVVDGNDGSTAAFVEASRRLGQAWRIELQGRLFLDADPQGDLAPLADDDFVNLSIARWF